MGVCADGRTNAKGLVVVAEDVVRYCEEGGVFAEVDETVAGGFVKETCMYQVRYIALL